MKNSIKIHWDNGDVFEIKEPDEERIKHIQGFISGKEVHTPYIIYKGVKYRFNPYKIRLIEFPVTESV